MKLALITFALIFSAHAGATTDSVRVRLWSEARPISISGMGLRISGAKRALSGLHAITVTRTSSDIPTWTTVDRDTKEIVSQVTAKSFELIGDNVRVKLLSAPSRVSLIAGAHGKVDIVGELDIESYVRGVLPSEMPSAWPLEALKAQAIAARSFAMYRRDVQRTHGSQWDVESDVMDQMFRNPLGKIGSEDSLANVDRAVVETRGVILQDRNAKPFAAYFHADCGGHTEDAKNVWGAGASAGTVVDGSCPLSPLANWTLRVTVTEISNRLKKSSSVAESAELTSFAIMDHTSSGRVGHVKLVWNDGEETALTSHQFRSALGFDRLKSTNFEITRQGASFLLAGHGYGHGVGLCQWGARSMARAGKSFKEILRHYYAKAETVVLN